MLREALLSAAGSIIVCAAVAVILIRAYIRRLRQAEAQLKESQGQRMALSLHYESVVTHIKEVIFQTDANRHLSFLNPIWSDWTGIDAKEAIGQRCEQFVHPDDRDVLGAMWQSLSPNGVQTIQSDIRLVSGDGGYMWVELYARAVWNEEGMLEGLSGRLYDLTERRQAEDKLRASQELYRNLVELSPDAIFVHANGEILFINERGAKLLGAESLEQLIGCTYKQFVHPEFLANFEQEMREIEHNHDHIVTTEKRYIRLDQSLIDVETSAKWISYYGRPAIMVFFRDITARKLQEKQLRVALEENSVLAAAISTTSSGVMITDPNMADNPIIYVNPAFETITGYPSEEVLGRNPRILQSDRQGKAFYQQMWAHIRKKGHWQGEIYNRKRNGDELIELLSITAIRDHRGELQNYAGVFSDITERKRMEQELKETNLYLHQLTSKDGLTGIFNRRYFDEQLKHAWRQGLILDQPIALVLLDIDHFKLYNDTYGHLEGDSCLKAVALALKGVAESVGAIAARYGGEEFAILFPDCSCEASQAAAERIRADVYQLRLPHSSSLTADCVTVSVGFAAVRPSEEGRPKELVAAADQALYEAKAAGRNQVAIYRKS